MGRCGGCHLVLEDLGEAALQQGGEVGGQPQDGLCWKVLWQGVGLEDASGEHDDLEGAGNESESLEGAGMEHEDLDGAGAEPKRLEDAGGEGQGW